MRFVLAAALVIAAVYAYSAVASAPAASPVVSNGNSTLLSNTSAAYAGNKLFFSANFSSENASQDVNSTFKWYKRTVYQPQNLSLVGYWKLDGNANDIKEEIA